MSLKTSGRAKDGPARCAALLKEALRAHESGDVATAARRYRDILAIDSGHADALNLLGVTELQLGRPAAAVEFIERAIAIQPNAPSFHQNLASSYSAAGDIDSAIAGYRRALALDPSYGQALVGIAALLRSRGQLDDAAQCYEQALSLDSSQPHTLNDLGNIYLALHRVDDAERCYRAALELQPVFPEAINNLGNVHLERKQPADAIDCFRRAITLSPDFALAQCNLGVALLMSRQYAEARDAFIETLKHDPDNVKALRSLADLHHQHGDLAEAATYYRRLVTLEPDNVDSLNGIGLSLLQQGDVDGALSHFDKALAINPNHAYTLNSYGNALCQQGKTAEAIGFFERALAQQPMLAEAHCNLGNALKAQDDLTRAIAHYRNAISLKPDYAAAHMNLGNAFKELGDYSAALGRFDEAILIRPDLAEAHLNKGIVMLTLGRFADAWKEYEWRIPMLEKQPDRRTFARPRWNGDTINGKRILIHAEQGIGDSIHFARYLPMVKALGAQVIFECQPHLVDLFAGLPGADRIVARDNGTPRDTDYDCHAYLLSLPALFGTTFKTMPHDVPYLRADPERARSWNNRMAPDDLNVGLVWAGNPNHGNDRNRSCMLADFSPIANIPGVTFHSLQKGAPAGQAAAPPDGMRLIDATAELQTFADTAALIDNLDLVITVDTSVAHLAGAMGKPVWVLIPHVPDWRWLLDRPDSPWYPSMRLFRQPRARDWASVFGELAVQLRSVAASKHVPQRYYEQSHDMPVIAIGRRHNHAQQCLRPNVLFSTTRSWNPGDEFIQFGVQNLLKELIGDFNSIIYNRNPDIRHVAAQYPDNAQRRRASGVGTSWIVRDNSWQPRINLESIDLAIFAGTPEWLGEMVSPLVERLVRTTLPTLYLGIGAYEETAGMKFEELGVMEQLLLIRSLLVTVRDEACANILSPINPHHMPCPALFASSTATLRTQKARIALSTQGISRINGQHINPAILHYTVNLYREIAKQYDCGLVCHYIDELDELAPLLGDVMEFHYSSDAVDYLKIYEPFDLTLTTRIHGAGLCASMGIPGFVISHSKRSSTARGFLSNLIDPEQETVQNVLARIDAIDVSTESRRLVDHKEQTRTRYLDLLRPALDSIGMRRRQ